MKLKVVTGLVLTLFLTGMLTLAFNIQPVKASRTIYIRADGSIDGPANITTVDYVTYYFNESNYDEIVVERNNIVIDGAGYTLQGTGSGTGIYLSSGSNVTIRNMNIKGFYEGIRFIGSSNNVISGNNITNNTDGISLSGSNNNIISGNNIANNEHGISLWSNNNTISGNNITANNVAGIWLSGSSNNVISGNNITANNWYGIGLDGSSNNNTVSGNNIMANSEYGIWLYNSSNNTISGNNITANNKDGIYLKESSYNSISGNNITNNFAGIGLSISSNNTISGNNITANSDYGIWLSGSSNNIIFHNNFVNNLHQVYTSESVNVWDDGYPSGGNYWSDYGERYPDAEEINGSGIWDTPYVIDENNQDNYPIVSEVDTVPPNIVILSPENKTYTTSSVSLSFTVDEATSWISYSLDGQSNVTIAGTTALSGLSDGSHSLIVYANDTAGNTGASETVYFTIETQKATPFPIWIAAAIVIIALVGAALLVYFTRVKKLRKSDNTRVSRMGINTTYTHRAIVCHNHLQTKTTKNINPLNSYLPSLFVW